MTDRLTETMKHLLAMEKEWTKGVQEQMTGWRFKAKEPDDLTFRHWYEQMTENVWEWQVEQVDPMAVDPMTGMPPQPVGKWVLIQDGANWAGALPYVKEGMDIVKRYERVAMGVK